MTEAELLSARAPFKVRNPHGEILTVVGFSPMDPFRAGVHTTHFEGGGWVMTEDLLRHFEIAREVG